MRDYRRHCFRRRRWHQYLGLKFACSLFYGSNSKSVQPIVLKPVSNDPVECILLFESPCFAYHSGIVIYNLLNLVKVLVRVSEKVAIQCTCVHISYSVHTLCTGTMQWRIQGGPHRLRSPLFSGDFFFFFFLVTPEVGLVGGWYPYPIMSMTQQKKSGGKNVGFPPLSDFSGLARHRGIWFRPALPFQKSWIRHCNAILHEVITPGRSVQLWYSLVGILIIDRGSYLWSPSRCRSKVKGQFNFGIFPYRCILIDDSV